MNDGFTGLADLELRLKQSRATERSLRNRAHMLASLGAVSFGIGLILLSGSKNNTDRFEGDTATVLGLSAVAGASKKFSEAASVSQTNAALESTLAQQVLTASSVQLPDSTQSLSLTRTQHVIRPAQDFII